jgi:hypothetical protein
MSDGLLNLPNPRQNAAIRHLSTHLTSKQGFRILHVVSCNQVTRQLIGFIFEETFENTRIQDYRALSYTWKAAVERAPEDSSKRCWEALIIDNAIYLIQNDDTTAERQGLPAGLDSFTAIAFGWNFSDFVISWVAHHLNTNEPVISNLWIDAICINQKNADEKQAQVPLMGEIYANATEVMVWLGRDSSDWAEFKWLNESGCPELVPISEGLDRERFLTTMSEHDPLSQTSGPITSHL